MSRDSKIHPGYLLLGLAACAAALATARRRTAPLSTSTPTAPNAPEERAAGNPSKADSAKRAIPSYLKHNSWEQELNFKLWVTKGARFAADKRCQRQNFWSKLSLNFLSAYLIVLGLAPSIFKAASLTLTPDTLNLAITAVSILALVWGLLESSKQYDLQAYKFHTCALAAGRLYSRLRRAKELPTQERGPILRQISEEYDRILEASDNHEPIDYDAFKLQKPRYFGLTWADRIFTRMRLFAITRLTYLLITVIPAIMVFWMIYPALVAMQRQGSETPTTKLVPDHRPITMLLGSDRFASVSAILLAEDQRLSRSSSLDSIGSSAE